MAVTLHTDATVDTDIWVNYQAGTPFHNTTPVDSDPVQVWDDADALDRTWLANTAGSEKPLWREVTPLTLLPSLDFDGTDDYYLLYDLPGTSAIALSNCISAGDFSLLASVYIEGVATNNAAVYENDPIIGDAGQFWGIFLKNASGTITMHFYNFDGSVDTFSITAALNTRYVIAFWQTGGSIFAELYNTPTGPAAGSGNTASGNTSDLTAQMGLGRTAGTPRYNGRINEVIINNAYNAGTFATALASFRTKHLDATPATSGGGSNKITRGIRRGMNLGMNVK